MRTQSGQGLVGILVGGAILLMVIYGLMLASRMMSTASRGGREANNLTNLLTGRLSLLKDVVQRQIGTADYLRRFATQSGSAAAFNPVLDRDPNTTFTAFSGLPNPETLPYEGSQFTLTYRVTLNTVSFHNGKRRFLQTAVGFPNANLRLNEVGTVVISLVAQSVNVAQTRLNSEVILAVP